MILGFFFVRPIPLSHHDKAHEQYQPVSAHPERLPASLSIQRNDSHSPLLSSRDDDASDLEEEDPRSPGFVGEAGLAPERTPREHDLELSPQQHLRRLPSPHDDPVGEPLSRSLSRGAAIIHDTSPNVYGLKLWKSADFYLLFSILSLCEWPVPCYRLCVLKVVLQ